MLALHWFFFFLATLRVRVFAFYNTATPYPFCDLGALLSESPVSMLGKLQPFKAILRKEGGRAGFRVSVLGLSGVCKHCIFPLVDVRLVAG